MWNVYSNGIHVRYDLVLLIGCNFRSVVANKDGKYEYLYLYFLLYDTVYSRRNLLPSFSCYFEAPSWCGGEICYFIEKLIENEGLTKMHGGHKMG
jgi:hypothetical protein